MDLKKTSWKAVYLVCKDCGKRRNGPSKKLKTKLVVGELRQASRRESPRARVLQTGCLGLCPKRALAVAHVGGAQAPVVAAVDSMNAVTQLVERRREAEPVD